MRVGGINKLMSTMMSWNLGCCRGWPQISVISATFSHPGYGSKGTANIVKEGAVLDASSFLMAAATRWSCPLSAGAQVMRDDPVHCAKVVSMSAGAPHKWEYKVLVVGTSINRGFAWRLLLQMLLRFKAMSGWG